MGRRSRLWGYVGVLVGVVAWLGIHWPQQSLWYDEALSAWVAGSWERLLHWCTQVDIQVPLHYIALLGWSGIAGNSEFSLHLLSALCGLLAVAGLMALVHRLIADRAAPIAAVLFASTPSFLWVAYEVRAYALALALFTWASVLLYELLKPRPPRRWLIVAYSALMLAMLYTHYTALAAIAAHAAIIGWTVIPRPRRFIRRFVWCGLIIALGFAPWLPVLLSRGVTDRSYYAGRILPHQTIGVILSFKWLARDDFKWLTPDQMISPLAPLIAVGLALLIVGVILWLVRERRWPPILYGLVITLLPTLVVAVVVFFKPKLAGRYVWPVWVGLDILITCGMIAFSNLLPLPRRTISMALLTFALIAIPWLTGQTGHPPDSDFRGVFAYIRDHWQPGDTIILRDGTLFPAAEYYQSPRYVRIPPDAQITDAMHVLHVDEVQQILLSKLDNTHGVWVVAWQGDVMDPENMVSAQLETVGIRQPVTAHWGDVSLDYFTINRPLTALEASPTVDHPLAVLPGGLALEAVGLATFGPLHPGDTIIAHTWWRRPGPVSSNARVSIRLYGPDGKLYGQKDQPPAGWFYFPDRWPDNTPILGRYDMLILPDAPASITMKLTLYSAANDMQPTEITVGSVQVVTP